MHFQLKSHDFTEGSMIPDIFTCDDKNISPSLFWENPPLNSQSFVLIVDDPDAPMGTWDHWILYNLPKNCFLLEKNIEKLPIGTIEGINSWGKTGYGGPCPPDKEHRYFFKLYALDIILENKKDLKKDALLNMIKNNIVGKAQLIGKYDLKKRR
ncbi:MAG: YbhB/YbcL family Raf kinase inhibitor-like protein [Alphaproteobacteria bacterium]|nr:YbhB/YbcL family Raf kinase inhibitor-like protein [Alphaproteobacteria bacterium]MDP3533703.1 YbhB/YbcL family Raf kinase inhibitor-like protein [Alphaproteobacteria bacterium]